MLSKNKKKMASARKKTDGGKELRKRLPPPATPPPMDRAFQAIPLFSVSLALLVWLTLAASLFHLHPVVFHDYVVGQAAPGTIHTEVEFDYVDHEATERKREAARKQVPLVFRVNEEINRKQLALVEAIRRFHQRSENDLDNELAESLAPAPPPPPELDSALIKLHQQHEPPEIKAFLEDNQKRIRLVEILQSALHRGVRPENIEDLFLDQPGPRYELRILDPLHDERSVVQPTEQVPTPEQAAANVQQAFREQFPGLSRTEHEIGLGIAAAVVTPNLSFHPQRTEEYRQQAASRVENVMRAIAAGEILVQRGEQLTAADLEKIYNYQRQIKTRRRQASGWAEATTLSVLALILILGFGQGLLLFNRQFLHRHGHLLLIVLLVVIQVAATHLTIHLFQVREMSFFYLLGAMPAALAAVLAAQLAGLRIAVWTTIFTSLVAALQAGNSLQVFIVASVAGVVGALLVYRARRRIHMFRAGVWLGLTFFFTTGLFFLPRGIPAEAFGCLAIVALINGLGTTILASTLMPIFEYAFGIVTDISLLEMSDLNHPLLRRLQIEAPGTFHHSLMVSILAEQAANAIGANPLLTRVSAYFHDIGKISQAEYFTENAMASGAPDAHSNLQPRMSSLIILNHVKEGLALAGNYKLNKTLREAIAQHHGTSLIYYFYHRASEQHAQSGREHASPGQYDYRYPGPLPVRKEVVLIGLADACEAAARALQKPTPQKLQALVGEIISGKLHDGQLDQADLTFQELALAREAMVKTLCTMYHGRISYPHQEEQQANEDEPDSSGAESASAKPAPPEQNA